MDTRYSIAAALTCGTVAFTAYYLLCRYNTCQAKWHARTEAAQSSALQSVKQVSKSRCKTRQQTAAGRYDWAQSLEEVLIEVLVPPNTSAEDVYIKFDATNLAVALNSQLILSGQLSGITDPSVNSWHLEGRGDQRILSITLCKNPSADPGETCPIWNTLWLERGDGAGVTDQLIKQ